MMLDVIKNVYEKMISIVCMGIDEKDHPLIREEYQNLLVERYKESDSRLKNIDYDKLYKVIYNIEYKRWNNLSPMIKKNLLINDTVLDEVICLSNLGFECARKRLEENVVVEVDYANNMINKMNEMCEKVRDENKYTAERYVSEGTVDFLFASGQVDGMSMRMGRFPKVVLKK